MALGHQSFPVQLLKDGVVVTTSFEWLKGFALCTARPKVKNDTRLCLFGTSTNWAGKWGLVAASYCILAPLTFPLLLWADRYPTLWTVEFVKESYTLQILCSLIINLFQISLLSSAVNHLKANVKSAADLLSLPSTVEGLQKVSAAFVP